MADVGAEIAARLEAANEDAIAVVLGPAREHWSTPTEAEGWPVGVTARHIALGHELMGSWARALAAGASEVRVDDVHAQNAETAARGVVASPEEVAELLRANGARTVATLRSLTAEQLDGEVAFGGRTLPRRMVAEASFRHVEQHLNSIRAVAEAGEGVET